MYVLALLFCSYVAAFIDRGLSAMTAACAVADSLGGFFLARAGVGLGEACLVTSGQPCAYFP